MAAKTYKAYERRTEQFAVRVTDFKANGEHNGFVSTDLHFNEGAEVEVRQLSNLGRPFVTVSTRHATVFLSVEQAKAVRDALNEVL